MQVIQDELYRNIALAFACVLIMTLILLANVWSCVIVCVCVIMCLVRMQKFSLRAGLLDQHCFVMCDVYETMDNCKFSSGMQACIIK